MDAATVRAHVVSCPDCAGFAASLPRLGAPVPEPSPELAGRVLASLRRRPAGRPARAFLRVGVEVSALAELAYALYQLLTDTQHDVHESCSLTVAICAGLLIAASRPRLAAPYFPIAGVASLMLVVTSFTDVDEHRVGVLHEAPHLSLVVGTVMLGLLAWEETGPPTWLPRRRPRRVVPSLRVVPRALRVALGVGLALGLVLIAGPAEAHAVLEGSTPGQGALVASEPTDVTLTFDEAVTTLPTSLQVFAPDGSRIDRGTSRHPSGTAKQIAIDLGSTAQRGTFLVAWRVISADSHPVSGAFTFSVGTTSKAPVAPSSTGSRPVAWSLGAARWLGYVGSALLLGVLVVVAWCWPQGRSSRVVRRLLWSGVGAFALAVVLELLLKGPYDASLGLSTVGRSDLVREVLGTTYGRAAVVQLVLVGVGALLIARAPRWPVTVWALLVGVTFAFAGHAAAGSQRALAMLSETVHALAASIWLGGLVVLLAVVLRGTDAEALPVVRRFSRLAFGCVSALVVTGLFQAWRGVGWSWGALAGTTYGHELLFKLAFVLYVLFLAGLSRAWVWRKVTLVVHAATATASPAGSPPQEGIELLRRTVAGETLGVLVVLALTSGLVATEPAKTAYHPTTSADLVILGDTVQVSAVPVGDRQVDLHLYLFDKSGQPTNPSEVDAAVTLGSVGPLAVRLDDAGPGHQTGVVSVPIAGTWKLAVTVRTTAIDEGTKTVDLPIR